MMTWRQFVRGLSLRRLAASLLLLVMAGDLALHIAEAYLEPPVLSGETVGLSATQLHAHGDETNCPIPGHSGGRSHHHHFPGIIASASEASPSQRALFYASGVTELAGSAARIPQRGRAPPLS